MDAEVSLSNVATRAVIGGLIGSIASGILVFLVLGLLFEALIIFSVGGFLGGAIFGIILGIPYKDTGDKKVGAAIGGVIGGIIGCSLFFVIPYIYAGIPWPSPQPYPDIQTQRVEGAIGSWGLSRVQTYTTILSLDEVEQHYQTQMTRYCIDDTERHYKVSSSTDHAECFVSECEIPRFGLGQTFEVKICSASASQIKVFHIDAWED